MTTLVLVAAGALFAWFGMWLGSTEWADKLTDRVMDIPSDVRMWWKGFKRIK